MNKHLHRALLVGFLAHLPASGQGLFQYDQQSSDESRYKDGFSGLGYQPLGQSFTPTLSSVGFIRIYIYDGLAGANSGVFTVNLHSDSITGPILATSRSVSLNNGFAGPVDFLFDTAISLDPGTTYYFQPVVQSGGGWGVLVGPYNYGGGTFFAEGNAYTTQDMWFREGIIVPEPSMAALIFIGGLASLVVCRRKTA